MYSKFNSENFLKISSKLLVVNSGNIGPRNAYVLIPALFNCLIASNLLSGGDVNGSNSLLYDALKLMNENPTIASLNCFSKSISLRTKSDFVSIEIGN